MADDVNLNLPFFFCNCFQIPAFEGTDGTIIIESGAIAYYRTYILLRMNEEKQTRKKRKRMKKKEAVEHLGVNDELVFNQLSLT